MRNFIVLLFGSFTLLLATACSRPAPPALSPAPVDYFYREHRCAPVEDSTSAPAKEQLHVRQVATPAAEVTAPPARFYTRWRRVHGRWYHFTYRVGDKRAMVQHPESGLRSTGPQIAPQTFKIHV